MLVIPKNRDGLTRLSSARDDQKQLLGHMLYTAGQIGKKGERGGGGALLFAFVCDSLLAWSDCVCVSQYACSLCVCARAYTYVVLFVVVKYAAVDVPQPPPQLLTN